MSSNSCTTPRPGTDRKKEIESGSLLKAGVHVKAVLRSLNTVFLPISR